MRWLSRGLCLCFVVLFATSCAQDKKLPVGERLSILDDFEQSLTVSQNKIATLPAPYINNSWSQAGINTHHIIGNLKAGFDLKEQWGENFGKGINRRDILLPSPVVGNNKLFVMDSKGVVSAFGLSNGNKLWKNTLSAKNNTVKDTKSRASGLALDNSTLFATTGFGGVFAMNAETGQPKWRIFLESPIRIAPTVTDKMLLVQTVDNSLYALDKNTGKELWKFNVAHEDTVIAGGAVPAYDEEDNVVVAGFSNGEIVVLNATVGTPLWTSMLVSNEQVNSSTEINTIGSYPIIQEGIIYAVSNSNSLVSLDMRTGDKLWEKEIGSMQNMLLAGDYLFVISNKNVLFAVEKYSGDIMWSVDVKDYLDAEDYDDMEIYAAPPLMLNGQIFLAFSNGKVLKFDAQQGGLKAKTDLGVDISNGLIAVNGMVIAVTDSADVIVFK